jgi:hypothetical protein
MLKNHMKHLSVLLALKKGKNEFVVQSDAGTYSAMTTGSKGIVKVVDHAICQELFGEYPLSEENYANFIQLTKMKLPKVKKSQEPNVDTKPKVVGKAA